MKTKRFRLPLRQYFTFMFAATLTACVFLAMLLVTLGFVLIYRGEMTSLLLHLATFFVCVLTILFGAISMWYGARHLTKPIEEVNRVVANVSRGEFVGRVERNEQLRKGYAYYNELDELSESINDMIRSLAQMDYMRKDFMTNVSHELKTPIAAIANISELLQNPQLDEASRLEFTRLIQVESQRLSRLCDTILQMSRVDNLDHLGPVTRVRVDEQIRQAMIALSEKWQEKEISFRLDSSAVFLDSNPDLLMQVWVNLLDNAIKYSGQEVDIAVSVQESEQGLIVVMEDKGCGISEELLPRIFEKFYQTDQSHHQEGNGLGLAIVDRIIRLCGGQITVTSQLGTGSRFEVHLPR
ncbi:sensor histidine kinase [Streptococcus sp. 20-1249]|uniref:sensor histidine kinase n=1 Tax=Streptococcus hepaticus TaxID=3349163 RepID=UPI003748E544